MQFNSRRSTVMARNGMVAASQPLAAMAGLRMLMNGGHAVDAAVATAAALNVLEPAATGVGGDAFALIWQAKDKKVYALNGSGRAPAAASIADLTAQGLDQIPNTSAYSVTVPGAVSAWQAVLDTFGHMPMSEVLKPAIAYASKGYPVPEVTSSFWLSGVPRLSAQPSGAELLLHGDAPKAGQVMKIPTLARSLEALAEGGAEAFYHGPLAQKITSYVQEMGGWLTLQDMAQHSADWVEPAYTDYRGVRCWECPPNTQGLHVLMALNIAAGYDIASMGYQSAETYHHLIESMRLSLADGTYHITDPKTMRVSAQHLLSKEYARQQRQRIRPDRALENVTAGLPQRGSDTVYFSCVDGEGNACSFINSVYSGFGSGLVAPGTGIALQSRGASFSLDADHPNALEPHKRPFHTLIPGLATKNNELWLSYGVMGTVQQAQGHFQVLLNMIDFGLDPQAALNAPRFSIQFDGSSYGDGTFLEDLVEAQTVRTLIGKGHDIVVHEPHVLLFGGGQIIERNPETGVLQAGSEPRMDGAAVGW